MSSDQPNTDPPVSSARRRGLLAWLPGSVLRDAQLEDRLTWETKDQLAFRLTSESAMGEMGHLVLAPIVGLMVWDNMPHTAAVTWLSIVALAALIRGMVVSTLRREGAPPDRVRLLVRVSVAVLSLAWGAGGAVAAQTL